MSNRLTDGKAPAFSNFLAKHVQIGYFADILKPVRGTKFFLIRLEVRLETKFYNSQKQNFLSFYPLSAWYFP